MKFTIREMLLLFVIVGLLCVCARHEREIATLKHYQSEHFTHHIKGWIDLFDRMEMLTSGNPNRDQDIAILQGQVDALQSQVNQIKEGAE